MTSLLLPVIYLAFISLGLPDSLLGSAWPVMHSDLSVPLSASGVIFMIISLGTVVSSLASDRLNRRFGTGLVTAVSVAMTMMALFGFSRSRSYLLLCLLAVPYGLGAGSVDAALNNYVTLHYASRHMSWLHCMWGIGASIGPAVMGAALASGRGWPGGYRSIGFIQLALTAVLFLSLPLWRRTAGEEQAASQPVGLRSALRLPGAKAVLVCFLCYCGLEQSAGLWTASYLVSVRGLDAAAAARGVSLFYLGITAGRAASGFMTMRFDDTAMIRLGQGTAAAGIALLLLPLPTPLALAGLVILGLGCAPIYPCVIHSTPARFGPERSQALIGLQMASAYIGTMLIPPCAGALFRAAGMAPFPACLALLLALMALMHERLARLTR